MPGSHQGGSAALGLTPRKFATHSMRRTNATLIYCRTGNLRALQLLFGHSKIESAVLLPWCRGRQRSRDRRENRRLMDLGGAHPRYLAHDWAFVPIGYMA